MELIKSTFMGMGEIMVYSVRDKRGTVAALRKLLSSVLHEVDSFVQQLMADSRAGYLHSAFAGTCDWTFADVPPQ